MTRCITTHCKAPHQQQRLQHVVYRLCADRVARAVRQEGGLDHQHLRLHQARSPLAQCRLRDRLAAVTPGGGVRQPPVAGAAAMAAAASQHLRRQAQLRPMSRYRMHWIPTARGCVCEVAALANAMHLEGALAQQQTPGDHAHPPCWPGLVRVAPSCCRACSRKVRSPGHAAVCQI